MSEKFFDLLNIAFKLMSENKLRKDIDDTLLEKLLTLIKKSRLKSSDTRRNFVLSENHENMQLDFIEELVQRTEVLCLVEKIISSIIERNENHPTLIKSFVIRLLGLIFMSNKKLYPHKKLLPLLKCTNKENLTDHDPSIQDALLACLSCITKQLDGALWFIDQNLKDFVFSSFNSRSYYVRKSAIKFFVDFISQWSYLKMSDFEKRKHEEIDLEHFMKNVISYIINHIHFYNDSKDIIYALCCISIIKKLLELENIQNLIGDHLNLAKNISECFLNLSEDVEFNKKIMDLFLTIHFKFGISDEVINVIKCLILKEDIKLAIDLSSAFARITWTKECCPDELMFFLLPLHILMNIPRTYCNTFFTVKSDLVHDIMLKKMEDKSECKILFSSSLSALKKVVPQLNSDLQRNVVTELLKINKNSAVSHHKWLYSVLEDRVVHHSFIEFYSTLLSEDVYMSLKFEGSDLAFQSIIEFLKKPSSDCNFLSQLLLLMREILILHKKFEFNLKENERDELILILSRGLHDNRESVVDSAIHVAGQMINNTAWQEYISKQSINSVIWDIAIQGNHDGSIRSTALKVIIDGCLETSCLNKMKALKGVTENDITKILFDLVYDPDFFLQREALSSLHHWVKSKWNDLQPSSKEYLFSALVTAIKSLDLELKLISLDVWLWLLENKFMFSAISPSLEVKEYIEYLANSGFGLSMILSLEDYDEAVQFKSADIMNKLKKMLISRGNSFDSLILISTGANKTEKCDISVNLAEPITKEEKDKGIDIVMKISTTEQITNICHPNLSELYDFKQEYFSSGSDDRKCPISSFWACLWSEDVATILQPTETEDINTLGESLLSDIISARILEYDSVEDTHDCY